VAEHLVERVDEGALAVTRFANKKDVEMSRRTSGFDRGSELVVGEHGETFLDRGAGDAHVR